MDLRYHKELPIRLKKVLLHGELVVPFEAKAIVIFAHGSGSSRFSPRNQQVAHYLHQYKFGTLLFDLLTKEEDEHYHNRFNIDLLSERLAATTNWLRKQSTAADCSFGYFGASTGAASAIKAASVSTDISAIVSRGGRADLAGIIALQELASPTLLIVGELDFDVINLNKQALSIMTCEKRLEIVPGATHLFEEQGAMQEVCRLAKEWFQHYLQPVQV
jgi:putative phosphoribosyl transferase